MGGLRAVIEKDLAHTLEGDYGMHVEMIDPDGVDRSLNTLGQPVMGRFIYDHAELSPDGMTVIVHAPVLTLRASTLTRIPQSGEHWIFRCPITVYNQAVLITFLLDPDRPIYDGKSLGILRIYLTTPTQSANQITAFSIGAHVGVIDQLAKTIHVSGTGSPVTALVPAFTLSAGAEVFVGLIPQTSTVTPNDFTAPVTYSVEGIDGTQKSYVVTVTP